jgi:hypothetical protein
MRLQRFLTLALVIVAVFASSCKSPEETITKIQAVITLALKDSPTIHRYAGGGTLHIEDTAIVSCTNQVGGTISSLTVTWKVSGSTVATTNHAGGRVAGNGSLDIVFDSECSALYQPDTVVFRVVGTDSNGYAIDKSLTYTYDWDIAGAGFVTARQ